MVVFHRINSDSQFKNNQVLLRKNWDIDSSDTINCGNRCYLIVREWCTAYLIKTKAYVVL
jgi:hypothetical protein